MSLLRLLPRRVPPSRPFVLTHKNAALATRPLTAPLSRPRPALDRPCRANVPCRTLHTTRRLLDSTSPRGATASLTNILASGTPPAVQVSSLTPSGIHLEDGLLIPGAAVFLDGKVFLWDAPPSVAEWRKEHLAVFEVVVPRPEILILGTGSEMAHPPPSVRAYLTDLGIQVDVMSTRNACSTYNLLAEEGRRVAAALAPLEARAWDRIQMRST